MKEDGPRVINDTMKVKDVPGTDAALNEMKEELKEELKLMKEELMKMMKEELMEMKEELRQAVAIMKEHPVAMMKEQKRGKGQLNGRQAAALALQKVTTVTCRVSGVLDTQVCRVSRYMYMYSTI